jgi:hypothetical protein
MWATIEKLRILFICGNDTLVIIFLQVISSRPTRWDLRRAGARIDVCSGRIIKYIGCGIGCADRSDLHVFGRACPIRSDFYAHGHISGRTCSVYNHYSGIHISNRTSRVRKDNASINVSNRAGRGCEYSIREYKKKQKAGVFF